MGVQPVGTVIPAALVTGINSDLPGQMIATVTQNVYDTVTGNHLLIPQGFRMLGQYDAQVAYGQRRVLLVWTRLIMPDGSSIILDRLQGVDTAGYSASSTIFASRDGVVNGVRVALAATPDLVHERLHAGHDRRRERGASAKTPVDRRPNAGRAEVSRVRETGYKRMVPRPVGREHRDVRQVPNAIGRVPEDSLPAGFLPAPACAVRYRGIGMGAWRASGGSVPKHTNPDGAAPGPKVIHRKPH
jgi:Bacterial conjugation TrbI-like protein